MRVVSVCFFKQKMGCDVGISDGSSDVCSSDLHFALRLARRRALAGRKAAVRGRLRADIWCDDDGAAAFGRAGRRYFGGAERREFLRGRTRAVAVGALDRRCGRSEEHTSELQSLMRISYAVFCLKKKKPTMKY